MTQASSLDIQKALMNGVLYQIAAEDYTYAGFDQEKEDEMAREYATELFLPSYQNNPIKQINALNVSIKYVADKLDIEISRVCREAVKLEILLDKLAFRSEGDQIFQGIPLYLMEGYTDMGSDARNTGRNSGEKERKKFRISKEEWLEEMAFAKSVAIDNKNHKEVYKTLYDYVVKKIPYVNRQYGDEDLTIDMAAYKDGGVCRHIADILQILMQTAGLYSNVVKGSCRGRGRHVWVEAQYPYFLRYNGNNCTIDPTWGTLNADGSVTRWIGEIPSGKHHPTPDHLNNYKIKHDGKYVTTPEQLELVKMIDPKGKIKIEPRKKQETYAPAKPKKPTRSTETLLAFIAKNFWKTYNQIFSEKIKNTNPVVE
ncbi:hypothetical protein GF371_01800 [Candidatus Woesearchaeota archaeon]|nr:hypothetical protein [Candidatus Woesearchaeota archaeon]